MAGDARIRKITLAVFLLPGRRGKLLDPTDHAYKSL
jgi:hypothetical protein